MCAVCLFNRYSIPPISPLGTKRNYLLSNISKHLASNISNILPGYPGKVMILPWAYKQIYTVYTISKNRNTVDADASVVSSLSMWIQKVTHLHKTHLHKTHIHMLHHPLLTSWCCRADSRSSCPSGPMLSDSSVSVSPSHWLRSFMSQWNCLHSSMARSKLLQHNNRTDTHTHTTSLFTVSKVVKWVSDINWGIINF